MKKLFILVLAVVFTLSFVAVASASTFDPYIGGRVTWAYISSDSTNDNYSPVTLNNSGLKALIEGKIKDEATGTWATIGFKVDGWPDSGTDRHASNIYDFGINKIAGSPLSIWYTNWENQNAKRGLGRVYDLGLNYHEDPMFDHSGANAIGIDYNTDSVDVNLVYTPNAVTDTKSGDTKVTSMANDTIAAVTFKFDGGNVHAAYWNGVKTYDINNNTKTDAGETFKANEINVGGEAKIGFGAIKLDYVSQAVNANVNNKDYTYDGGNIIEGVVSIDAIKLEVTVISDNKYKYQTDGGFGYQVKYSGIADGKVTLAYKAMAASDDADAVGKAGDFGSGDFQTAYIGYKYGIFETRLGFGTHGKDATVSGVKKEAEDFVYASVYASLW